jgi:very-short-patch-repair endonuclease
MIPNALSPGECEFALHCRAHGLRPEREWQFHPTRKFRFDFAFPDAKLAVEIEGGIWRGGRHCRGTGFENDCIKYSEAAILGWRIIRATTEQVMSGQAINWTLAALAQAQQPEVKP